MLTNLDKTLIFAHVGDLHLTDAKQQNYHDFLALISQIAIECAQTLDFVVLPGDNADNGRPDQYALAKTALKMLDVPVHVIPGDHDMEQGSLDAFYGTLNAEPLPYALTVRGVRCFYLDISGPGSGGPDFRLGSDQLRWLEDELEQARERGETSLICMHSYPADLKGEGETEALNRLLAQNDVALVDIGHTHYNELANDGRTIFAATRSTGQIEEGPVGYSLVTIDNGVVAWRFKPLDEAFPFVTITSPADHRLQRESIVVPDGETSVRAVIFGKRTVVSVDCRIEDGEWTPMNVTSDDRVWSASLPLPSKPLVSISVRAIDSTGRPGLHTIVAATSDFSPRSYVRDGSDADAVGAWPENGIPGTQLGPNRNGKPTS